MHADSDDDYGYDDYDGNGGEDYFAVRGVVFLTMCHRVKIYR